MSKSKGRKRVEQTYARRTYVDFISAFAFGHGGPINFDPLYLTGSTWADQKKNGGKFYVDLSNDEGSKLMGPPCPKAKAERELNRLMHAEHM